MTDTIVNGLLWRGQIAVHRRQYSLWIGALFIGEVVYDNQHRATTPWRAELSTQKYLQTVGRYSTETEAQSALLDAAVEALNKE